MSETFSLQLTRDLSYKILIEDGLCLRLADVLKQAHKNARFFLITHPNIHELHGKTLVSHLEQAGLKCHVLTVAEGESSKSLTVYHELLSELLAAQVERHDVILALGGGVIGDLAGFVASSCLRGLPFYQIPTTLLAQVDASIGGKTGINHASGKNLIGAFYQPQSVLVDPLLLGTLDPRQLRSGLAEVIKYGVIWDADLFAFLEEHVAALAKLKVMDCPDLWQHLIQRSGAIKAHIVQEDEQEQGLRAILNYGHTVGHGIESAFGYGHFLHGEAVALGMLAANELAQQVAGFPEADAQRIRNLLAGFGFKRYIPACDAGTVLAPMKQDKKRLAAAHRFVLPSKIGQVALNVIEGDSQVLTCIKNLMMEEQQ
eukprot:COSAG01_NODE_165_length_23303_cov_269.524953_2_plen_372_part_00